VTWALFGIQEIGNWIEEPFRGSLKLGVLCDTVFKDVRETAKHFSALRKKKGPEISHKLSRLAPETAPAANVDASFAPESLALESLPPESFAP
jgi:hypothetical protein